MQSDTDKARMTELKRRAGRARNISVTCPASRHLHLMADRLAAGKPYPMLTEEPQHCAESILAVLAALWTARAQLARLQFKAAAIQSRRDLMLSSPEMAASMRRLKARMAKDPEFARSLLTSAGITNADGTLAEQYGGAPQGGA